MGLHRGVPAIKNHLELYVTERHYNKWVRNRTERLERLVADSCMHPVSDAGRDREANVTYFLFPSTPAVFKPKYTGLVGKLPRNRVTGPAPKRGWFDDV